MAPTPPSRTFKMFEKSSRNPTQNPGVGSESVSRSDIPHADMQSLARGMMRSSLNEGSSASIRRPIRSPADEERAVNRHASVAGGVPPSAEATHRETNKQRIETRIRREGEATPSAHEAEARLVRLKNQENHTLATSKSISTAGIFKHISSTDLLFLMDTTRSMQPYISAAKEQVISIMKDIKSAFFNKADVRMAVVSYKDHCDGAHLQLIDFTSDVKQVTSFLGTLTAEGGGDFPEDVLGGLQQALIASWKHPTRCIIHICDAPPHGRNLHDLDNGDDQYIQPGSEPHGLTHGPMLQLLIDQNIHYSLLRINSSTDRMAYEFAQVYAAASGECKLHTSNSYHALLGKAVSGPITASFQGTAPSGRAKNRLNFEEHNLGTSYGALRNLAVKIVTTSATRSATLSLSTVARGKDAARGRHFSPLTMVGEEEDEPGVFLETTPPQWDTPGWLDEVVEFEAYTTDVIAHGGSMLDRMMAHDDNIKIKTTNLTIHKRRQPFAQGAMRVASYARSDASRNRLVVKSYKRKGKKLAHLLGDMRCQALCKAFALEFNSMVSEQYSLDFIVVTSLTPRSAVGDAEACLSLEPLIDGEYVKYNSNGGWVNPKNDSDPVYMAAQAFSHFTFERSLGRFLVSDLQGVGRVLTDPSVHTLDEERFRLTETNLRQEGFLFFFSTHKCNALCEQLKLKSNGAMVVANKYDFRKIWPGDVSGANMMVCCSNKLCSRIIRASICKTSDAFPGYRWCGRCWDDLQRTTKHVCHAPGPLHEFEVSRFFYESQGDILPRYCPKHRGLAVSKAVGAITRRVGGGRKCKAGSDCIDLSCALSHPS
ncbi:hypothetical protein LLEC1_02776 [Akanthomyces lecanii]|uniref:Alpha-type protein kinase domain-containing protein n=1 Tax=Cordyceps confragosa TaxID=2714763 RepID=A0A179I9G3_CORDF|nr:hypothetical protein LLEC1_02776 [Akanthomyces lecanii]